MLREDDLRERAVTESRRERSKIFGGLFSEKNCLRGREHEEIFSRTLYM
jgi:hypothetical protein